MIELTAFDMASVLTPDLYIDIRFYLPSSQSSVFISVKSADPTPTIMMDRGK